MFSWNTLSSLSSGCSRMNNCLKYSGNSRNLDIWSSRSKCATVIKYSTISMNDFAGKMQSAACPACHIKGADIMRINLPDASGKTQGFALLRSPSSNLHSLQIFHTLFKTFDLPKIDEREHFAGILQTLISFLRLFLHSLRSMPNRI
ncbi:hypothetical protein L596_013455 [Steinernema carpocapsae]|uniref:Uncharacterized protein n=1 Tax=Steinernema carpocapsae TaxID=34508 RepID=A0A4U5P128_STECR|nr:hypothetical protein L596_013455 [Steinernema carpocapsae]